MMRRELLWRRRQGPLVERDRSGPAHHRRSTDIVCLAAQQQQLDVARISHERAVERGAICGRRARVIGFDDCVQLLAAQGDPEPVTLTSR
jgi:hypothetical protein